LPILLPTKSLIDAFENIAEPVLAELFNIAKKNNLLRKTRDLLLPKLIRGEVDVK
jgi:type I restriction enzyme S subunit